jgi:outer membrane protein assembly complex protein YaeT
MKKRPNGSVKSAKSVRAVLLPAALIAVVGYCLVQAATAQPAPNRIAEILVRGNNQNSTNAILNVVKTRVGDVFDDAIVQADVKRLLDTGRYVRVTLEKDQAPQGVRLTFVVVEAPLIKRVILRGNKAFDYAALTTEAGVSTGAALNRDAVEAGRQAILKKYRSEGYPFAEVTLDARAYQDDQEVVYSIVEGQQVVISKVSFQGNEYFSTLRMKIETATMAKFWPFTKGLLDMDQIDGDATKIRNLYVEEGYLDAEVGRQLDYSDDKKEVRVTFLIREGERYRVNKVVFQGNKVFSDEQLAGRLTLSQGQFFTMVSLRRDLKKVQDTYGELGYINAKVDFRKQYLDPQAPLPDWAGRLPGKPALLNLIIKIDEYDQYRIGQVIIRGNGVTQARVIRRELRFFPEQLYDTVAVDESKKRLTETRLFEKVNITPSGKGEGVRDALVEVTEGQTASFMVGVGISSRDGLIGNISFTQRNFDITGWPTDQHPMFKGDAFKGAGQTLNVTFEPGIQVMRASIDWFEPYVFDQPYAVDAKVFAFDRQREQYWETRVGTVGSLGHTFANRWYGELAATVQDVIIHNLDDDAVPEVREVEGGNLEFSLKGTLARNRTDSRWMPTTGDSLRVSYEQTTGDFNFGRASGDYYIYHTVYTDALERKHVIAGHFAAGDIIGSSPVFENYYGGGLGSIRGFKYRGISPRSPGTDIPIGGKFLLFAGGEYSAPLIADVIRGVVFVDTGTVEQDIGITSYRASVGFGLRWVIPFFGPIPMALDFGFPIVKNSQDDTQILSFTLGWTF